MTENNQATELRSGYKKTKLGWIPVEWEIVSLGSISKITSGGTPNRKNKLFWNNGNIPWITTSLIDFNKITKAEEFITELGLKNSSTKLFPKGTMVMAMYGQGVTRGKVAILDFEASTNQACAAFLLNKNRIKVNFIFYALKNQYQNLRNLSNDGGQKNLSGSLLKTFKITLPSLPEQQKIAEILSCWDNGIEKLKQLIEAKEVRKKGLMQQLLTGKVRLKGFEDEWKKNKMNDVFERLTKSSDITGIPAYTISSKKGFVTQKDKFNRVIAGSSLSKYILLRKNDFSYNKGNSKTYPYGCVFKFEEKAGLVPFVYISFSAKKKIDEKFFKFYFEFGLLERQLKKIISSGARGDGLLNVNPKSFFNLEIFEPILDEQKTISKILSTADEELRLLKTKLSALEMQKKGLMQRLLTGKVRVKTERGIL